MKPLVIRLLAAAVVATPLIALAAAEDGGRPSAPRLTQESAGSAYGKMPLAFEANGGRTDKRVDFIARGAGYSMFLTPRESVLTLSGGRNQPGHVLRTRLTGASAARGMGESKLPGKVNSLI